MTNGELAFLALAEELNFTRAAERIYMSQQGLSDHIKRLEQEYDTILVTRKPTVELTESGKALQQMLIDKSAMEKDVKRMINDINKGDVGDVYIGITSSRLRVLTSDIVQRFYEIHPNVRLHIIDDLTVILLQMLEQGRLDCVIAENVVYAKECKIEKMFEDPVYMAVPEQIARERTGAASRVDIENYADLPFVRGLQERGLVDVIDSFTAERGITLNNIVSVSASDVQAALCVRLHAAMFCSKSFGFFSRGEIMRKGLRVLEINGLTHSDEISLVTMKNRIYPKCVHEALDVIRESLKQFYDQKIAE